MLFQIYFNWFAGVNDMFQTLKNCQIVLNEKLVCFLLPKKTMDDLETFCNIACWFFFLYVSDV